MTKLLRQRISVDLHGLRAVLFERARVRGVSPSELVRDALLDAMGHADPDFLASSRMEAPVANADRVRLSLRMSRADASATRAAARRAGLTVGNLVAGLVSEVPALRAGSNRADHIAALIASGSDVATLSRDIGQLTRLLREGNVAGALVYCDVLVTLDGDVRRHLALAADVLASLRPRRHTNIAPGNRAKG